LSVAPGLERVPRREDLIEAAVTTDFLDTLDAGVS
jgi:hypothetical protein